MSNGHAAYIKGLRRVLAADFVDNSLFATMSILRSLSILALATTSAFATPITNATLTRRAQPQGIDVSSHQPTINWATVRSNGIEFAFIKATEGTGKQPASRRLLPQTAEANLGYKNPEFSKQYTGATNNNIIRGGYHFALPDRSSGAAQATYFAANGGLSYERLSFDDRRLTGPTKGGWSGDGRTLPGALDIECKPLKPFPLSPPSDC